MTHRTGKVISKRNKYGIFGKKKYFVCVQFDQKFDRMGKNSHEFEVDKDLFSTIIIGACVRGEFQQAPEGLRPLYFY